MGLVAEPPAAYAQVWEQDLEWLRGRWGAQLGIGRQDGKFVAFAGFREIIAAADTAVVLDCQLAQRAAQLEMDEVRREHGHVDVHPARTGVADR